MMCTFKQSLWTPEGRTLPTFCWPVFPGLGSTSAYVKKKSFVNPLVSEWELWKV